MVEMEIEYLLKGICIGLIFGVPVGAIGALTIRRTITHGTFAGLASGIGCSTADLLYSFISVFGLTLFSSFMLKYQSIISLVGGGMVIMMGIDIILKKQGVVKETVKTSQIISFFVSSFAIAITNPTTIITFVLAFSIFHIGSITSDVQCLGLCLGIFIGTCIWWGLIISMIRLFRNRITENVFVRLNYILGSIIIMLGAGVGIRVLL
ncbi:LysE family translocator [Clostridium estertheticum]|uniref:LysE family translocator n=1 Tax=Clostridium estertheticum TaxID=238834 RepID=UPI001C0B4E50|nr:LysE family transporter [Clostridium estertheticum]MBU3074822.1 LysE family transporter [Clostridium estertheticum]MBU3165037.1 LysE family transporter [Clostridium estertheticum]